MARLPRIAVGTIQPSADGTPLVWALMDALAHYGLRVQNFLSRACFAPRDGATAITGQPSRHLDSWLMSAAACREAFARGCSSCDVAVVEGTFCHAQGGKGIACAKEPAGSDLRVLCEWLELPRLAIVDARLLVDDDWPELPAGIEGLLLDRVCGAAEAATLQCRLERKWGVPVLGWLSNDQRLRAQIAATPIGKQPALELCRALGSEFTRNSDLDRIYRLAKSKRLPAAGSTERCCRAAAGLRVAVAYDDAFHCYFTDTLDLLELKGALIRDFSPLRDDRLPPGSDVVYFGCGFPESHAQQLAENDCMILALKSHLASGRRIYAEGGGLAYLCQQMLLPDGGRWPMVGAIKATASLDPNATAPQPAERTIVKDTWLGQAPVTWNGYVNHRWTITPAGTPAGGAQACAGEAGHELDVIREHQAIGSRVHVNFAACETLLDRFFVPHAGQADPASRG